MRDLLVNKDYNILLNNKIQNEAIVKEHMHVKAIPKLKGGTKMDELKIIMGNIKGLPNNRNNQHKIDQLHKMLKN